MQSYRHDGHDSQWYCLLLLACSCFLKPLHVMQLRKHMTAALYVQSDGKVPGVGGMKQLGRPDEGRRDLQFTTLSPI